MGNYYFTDAGTGTAVGADGTIEVKLDFVIPAYRDFKAGDFLYSIGNKDEAAELEGVGLEPFTEEGDIEALFQLQA